MAPNPTTTPLLFDRPLLLARQARAQRQGPAAFLLDRVAEDMAERLGAVMRDFSDAADLWTPGEGLPHAPDGTLAPEIVWVALDCPSSFGTVPVGAAPHVLGRLEGRVDAPLHVGEEVTVVSWPLGHEGRKRWGASAVLGPAGDVRGHARATWIALR